MSENDDRSDIGHFIFELARGWLLLHRLRKLEDGGKLGYSFIK